MSCLNDLTEFLTGLDKNQLTDIMECDNLILDNLRTNECSIETFINLNTETEIVKTILDSFVFYSEEDLCEVLKEMREIVEQDFNISFLGYCTITAKSRSEAWSKFYNMVENVNVHIDDERIEN